MKLFKRILRWLLLIAITLALAEGAARIAGYSPLDLPAPVKSDPTGCLASDPDLGWKPAPGRFNVTLRYPASDPNLQRVPQGPPLTYVATHDSNSFRVTTVGTPPSGLVELLFLGCSMTYGQGVNDEETFPFLLQSAFPQVRVINASAPGWGTQHALLTARKLAASPRHRHLIVPYYDFHDDRNCLNSGFKNAVRLGTSRITEESGAYPFCRVEQGTLTFHHWRSPDSVRIPGVRHFALSRLLQDAIWSLGSDEVDATQSELVTEMLLLELQQLCKAHEMQLIVAMMNEGDRIERLMGFCAENDIRHVNAAVDLSLPGRRLLPHDSHPSPAAHRLYADNLIRLLPTIIEELR